MTMRAIIISNVLALCVIANQREKNDLNNSKKDAEPTVFWPVLRSRHNITDPQYNTAFLHSVDVVANPPKSLPYPIDFLKFTGTSDSFAEVPWNVNSFSTSTSMAILFYLYFEEPMQNATLIQFEGSNGGFELMLESGILKARFHSLDGTRFEHSAPEFNLKTNEWHFVGAEYNFLWPTDDQFDLLYVSESAFNATPHISTLNNVGEIPDIDINGCLRIGQNFNGDRGLKGYMSCLQLYAVSVHHPKEILKDLFLNCDPNLWSLDWDITADFVPESSPFCVSDVTTTQQMTSDASLSAPTTETGSTIEQSTGIDMSTIHAGTTVQQQTAQSGSTIQQSSTEPSSTVELSTKGHEVTTQPGSSIQSGSTGVQLTTDPVVLGSTVDQLSTKRGSTEQQFTTTTGSSVTQLSTNSEFTVKEFTTNPVFLGSTVQKFNTDMGSTVNQLSAKHGSTLQHISSSVEQQTTLSKFTVERMSTVEKLVSDYGPTVEQFTTQSVMTVGLGSGSTIKQSNVSNGFSSTTTKPNPWSYESPLERCVRFKKLSSDQAIMVADLGVYTFTTMSECVNRCLTNDKCSAISVEHVGSFIFCSTSSDYTSTMFASGHEIYYRLNA